MLSVGPDPGISMKHPGHPAQRPRIIRQSLPMGGLPSPTRARPGPCRAFLGPCSSGVIQWDLLARQDHSLPDSQAPVSNALGARAPARSVRAKADARGSELRRLLRRTLMALERDLPTLGAAEFSRAEVAAFLTEQLTAPPEPSAPARARVGSGAGEPAAERASGDRGAARAAVLKALRQLERESPPGALLSVRELRARTALDKPSFDRAALELAGQGRVSLHAHDHAGALADSERGALIEDVRGVFYIGIASIPDARQGVSP
jgi:hypothetical protein